MKNEWQKHVAVLYDSHHSEAQYGGGRQSKEGCFCYLTTLQYIVIWSMLLLVMTITLIQVQIKSQRQTQSLHHVSCECVCMGIFIYYFSFSFFFLDTPPRGNIYTTI